ncbi:MAG TPA: aldo/keto reductase [Burkholderiales bacterium]|nr:aldo/keto reductase [Burkholderiales bacterium]
MRSIKVGDLTVNRIGYGAMRVIEHPDIWGPPKDKANAHRVLRRAYELGANFFDTAESYGPHTSEIAVAEAMHPYPKDLVIATKCGLVRPKPSRWDEDGRPEKLRADLEGSLKRLKLERIDVYQLHAPDPKVPYEDQIGALAEFQREGKVRHVGLSNVTLKQLEQARKIVPIVSVQNRYNLGDRSSEDVLKACERLGIAFLPWYPLEAGSSLATAKVRTLAKKLDATPSQVVLAWLLKKSPVMLPIPGTGSVAHLEENMKAASLDLSDADFRML